MENKRFTNRICLTVSLVCAVFLILPSWVWAATKTWDGGGTNSNWGTSANWNPDGVPANGDDIYFPNPTNAKSTINLSANRDKTGGTLEFQGSGYTLNGAYRLTVGGGIAMSIAGTNTMSMSTLRFSADKSVNVLTGGTLIISANIDGAGAIQKKGNGTLRLSGTNTFTGGVYLDRYNEGYDGTLEINSASALGATASTLTIVRGTIDNTSGSSITLLNNNAQTWNGDFTFAGSNDLNMGTGAVTVGNNVTITVNSGTLTIGGDISGASYSITKAGAGALVLNGAINVAAINVSAGTLTLGSAAVSVTDVTVSGGTLNSTSGTLSVSHAFTNNSTFNHNSGTVDFAGTTSITGSGTHSFNNLTISNGTLTAPSAMTIAGTLTNNGTFTHNSGTVTFSGTTAIAGSSNTTFNNITVSSGTLTLPSAPIITGAFTNNGTLSPGTSNVHFQGTTSITGSGTHNFNHITIDSGTLTAPSGTISLAGDLTNNGAFTNNGGTVEFTGASSDIAGSSDTSFTNLTISSGQTKIHRNTYVSGNFTNNGTFTYLNSTYGIDTTLIFNGVTSAILGTPVSTGIYNLTIDAGDTLTGPTAMTIDSNFTNNGDFAHNSGTITFAGTNAITEN